MAAELLARGLVFRHTSGWALGPLDFVATPGVVTALIGPNGAGKTTLLRLLAGLLRPTGGALQLNGSPSASRWRLTRRVALAPTEPAFPVATTASDLLRLRANLCRCSREQLAEAEARLATLLERPLAVAPARLSRGQRLRLALALALLGDPEIVLADEPWSGLDPLAVDEVLATLAERSRRGAAVVVSSHDLYQLPNVADRFVFLIGGQVRAVGGLAELRVLSPVPDGEPAVVLKELYRSFVREEGEREAP